MEGTYCIYEPHNIIFFIKNKKKIQATFKEYTAGERQPIIGDFPPIIL